MDGTATSASARRTASRGRIDKRQAILGAAFTVFADQGYARAGMDGIAEVAGVAKHTVYNHFGDKENLFHAALAATADAVMTENLAIVEELTFGCDEGAEPVRSRLEDVGYRLLLQCCDPRSWALRRLLQAEITRFPELLEIVSGFGSDRLRQGLADRMARLALAGRLRICDPVEAAEQFLALLTGPMEARSQLGTRIVPESELRAVAGAAVGTFLRAFHAGP